MIADHLTVRRVALATLREDPGNVRRHSAKNRAAIRDSLRAFGQVEPLVVQAGSGLVIGGNGRLSVVRAVVPVADVGARQASRARVGRGRQDRNLLVIEAAPMRRVRVSRCKGA